jgi:hypothetical protein
MRQVLVPLLIVLMALTVWSLVRGIMAFAHRAAGWIGEGAEGLRDMHLLQNRMMMNRIKFQGLAIAVVILLLMVAGKH